MAISLTDCLVANFNTVGFMVFKVFFLHGRCKQTRYTLWSSNIALKHGPFEDAFPIKNGDFPLPCYFHWRVDPIFMSNMSCPEVGLGTSMGKGPHFFGLRWA